MRFSELVVLRYEVSIFVVHLRSAATYIRVNLQRSIQTKQQELAQLKLRITAIEAEAQTCRADIEALKAHDSGPEELLKAQEKLKAVVAQLKRLQMQLPKVTHNSLG